MFCKNCGYQMVDNTDVCVKCGVAAGQKNVYCPQCGVQADFDATFCINCGIKLPSAVNADVNQKSKLVAGLLGIFLGGLGIHNFYLGFQKRALVQLLVSLIGGMITCGVSAAAMEIWGLVEGVMILADNNRTDANGIPLKN